MDDGWQFADRLSDKIIDLVRAEMRARPDFSPLDLLVGQLLPLLALLQTAHGLPRPNSFRVLRAAVQGCLAELLRRYPEGPPRRDPPGRPH